MLRSVFSLSSAVKLAALAMLSLGVASCAADLNPSPAPTGYKYTGQQYNAPWTGPVKHMDYPGMNAVPAAAPRPAAPMPAAADLATPMAPGPGAPPAMAPLTGPMPVYAPNDQSAVTPGAGDAADSPVWHQAAMDLLNRTEHDFGRMRDAVYVRPAATPEETAFTQALSETMRQRRYKLSTDLQKSAFVADYSIAPGADGQKAISLKLTAQDGQALQEETGHYAMNGAMAGAAAMPMAPAVPSSSPSPQPAPPASSFWGGHPVMTAEAAPPAPPPTMPVPVQVAVPDMPPPAVPPEAARDQIPPSPGTVSSSNGTTYIYDGRATKPAGHTAYEQLQGVEHVVGPDYATDR